MLEGDIPSPLPFVLFIVPLNRKLNGTYPQVAVRTGGEQDHTTNHLPYIDDMRLLATPEGALPAMAEETKRFFRAARLEMNKEKSATNTKACVGDSKLLEGISG